MPLVRNETGNDSIKFTSLGKLRVRNRVCNEIESSTLEIEYAKQFGDGKNILIMQSSTYRDSKYRGDLLEDFQGT